MTGSNHRSFLNARHNIKAIMFTDAQEGTCLSGNPVNTMIINYFLSYLIYTRI
jgi:hypothetical protein